MRVPAKPIFFLPVLLFAYLLLPTTPAHAAERKMLGDVTVGKGETAEEASTMWGDVMVEGNVQDDVESGFGNIWVEGPVGGDVDAGSGDVHVNAPVGGDVDVGHGNVYLESGAQVHGDVSHHNGSLTLYPGGAVSGYQNVRATSGFGSDSPLGAFSNAIGWIVMPLGLIAAAVLLAVAAPRPLRASARSLEAAPVESLLIGLISVPVAVFASLLLAITVVGVLLLFLLWPAYLALLLFGTLVIAYFLGRKIVLATGRYYRAGDALAAAIGALLVWAAYLIPFLGGLLFAAVALLGAGGAVLALFGRRRPPGQPPPTYASYEEYLRNRDR